MDTRVNKYDNVQDNDTPIMSRVKRNQNIYNSNDMSELSRFRTNTNVSIISDAPKEMDINKLKDYLDSLSEEKEEKRNRLDIDLPKNEETIIERKEIRDYDINSVIENAREKKDTDYEEERHRKLSSTQYNILKSLNISNDEIKNSKDEETEKTIVDLINDIQNNSKKEKEENVNDLFKDLMSDNENTVVMAPIDNEELNKTNIKEALFDITTDLEKIKEPISEYTQELVFEKEKLKNNNIDEEKKEVKINNTNKISSIDKSFYTNSMTFTKTDFEGFEDLEKAEKGSIFTKIAIIFAILLLIVTVLLVINFVTS